MASSTSDAEAEWQLCGVSVVWDGCVVDLPGKRLACRGVFDRDSVGVSDMDMDMGMASLEHVRVFVTDRVAAINP